MCGATYAAATGVVKEGRAEAVGRARHRALSASSGPSSTRLGAVVGSVHIYTCETRNSQRYHLRDRLRHASGRSWAPLKFPLARLAIANDPTSAVERAATAGRRSTIIRRSALSVPSGGGLAAWRRPEGRP